MPKLFAAAALSAGLVTAVIAADVNDWPYHDHDAGGQRFSPLKQITPANVATLQRAWTFDTGVNGLQVTPLVINGIMYVTAGKDIIALEPESAKVIWRYTAPAAVSRRGVAYWPGDRDTPPRLFSGAGDRLLAVDAERGKPAAGFGDGDTGSVDLKASIRGDVDGGFSLTSPPTVYKNIVITGGNNGEGSPSSGLYGDIRGWDAKTGKLLWSFHTVPRAGEPGVETWEGDSWKNRSGTNVWSFFTIDVERGIVYAPLGSPTSDYYGADRKGANLYGNSIVALLNGCRLSGDRRYLTKAEELIRRCVHPANDIPALNLLDVERRWYYTVFLQSLGKYLDFKTERGELDEMYAYARATLLHYARWMAANEHPYLDKPQILEFPTETWAAQELWKSDASGLSMIEDIAPAGQRLSRTHCAVKARRLLACFLKPMPANRRGSARPKWLATASIILRIFQMSLLALSLTMLVLIRRADHQP
jgi:hypothetical protein